MASSEKQSFAFIPKVHDGAALCGAARLEKALIDANTIEGSPNVFTKLADKTDMLIVDPCVHLLPYKNLDDDSTSAFAKLPYKGASAAEKLYSDPTFRLEECVKKAVQYQLDKGADLLIAPYLYSDDINSTNFSTNITLVSETLINVKSRGISTPVYANIAIGSHILADTKSLNFVIDRYTDELVKEGVAGYFITIDGFDDREADEITLNGLAYMVYQLSQEKPVYVKPVGGFGLVLAAVGASGFTSSLGGGEVFSIKSHAKGGGRGRNHNEWMYVPELFDYINNADIARMSYDCTCPADNGTIAFESVAARRKAHFLFVRLEEASGLEGMSREDKIKSLKAKLDSGVTQAHNHNAKYGARLKTSHMSNWKHVLESIETWDYKEEAAELDNILAEIDKLS